MQHILIATMSLDILPIELVYKILDNLDLQTIIFSFQNVCKRFYAITNTYNRYELDLNSISKVYFHHICGIIRPETIISLILSDHDTTPGQISLFMSLFNIDQFIHLRSLTLIGIEKTQLNRLMNYVDIKSLNTLSINIRKNNSHLEDVSIIPLLSNIAMANLYKLELTMWSPDINDFIWPKQCTLRHLTIGHYMTYRQVSMIISQLTHLRTLAIRNCIITDTDEMVTILPDNDKNTNLMSLTFKNSRLQMNDLELLLSLTPSLVHLQLTGTVNSSDAILNGLRWEEFIQSKLPSLEKFEFFFRAQTDRNHDSTNIDPWIIPFRTLFWIKHKSWFVTCNYINRSAILRLYTVPICDPCIIYESEFDKTTCTTYPSIENDTLIMNNVREVQLDLIQMMNTVKVQNVCHKKFYKYFYEIIFFRLNHELNIYFVNYPS
jgi:hypothetical protein